MIRLALIASVVSWASLAAAAELVPGSPAPKLTVKEFVKGEPVTDFAKGTVYVVEFWATWCGPCIQNMPHLTALQKKHADVVFIGVSIWEKDQNLVKPFVTKMGDKMGYRVAMDDVPAGNANGGKMALGWMKAAGRNGIPSAFIVNGDGVIAWIGHPAKMDEALEAVVSGKHDVAAEAKRYQAEAASDGKLRELSGKLRAAGSDAKAALKVVDDAIAETPALEEKLALTRLNLLFRDGQSDAGSAYADKLSEGLCSKKGTMLASLGNVLVINGQKEKGIALIEKAVEMETGDTQMQIKKLLERIKSGQIGRPKP